jgi:hypothetical protein
MLQILSSTADFLPYSRHTLCTLQSIDRCQVTKYHASNSRGQVTALGTLIFVDSLEQGRYIGYMQVFAKRLSHRQYTFSEKNKIKSGSSISGIFLEDCNK